MPGIFLRCQYLTTAVCSVKCTGLPVRVVLNSPQSPRSGTEPEGPPNTQVTKQKDSKSSHSEAASGNLPVPSATLPYKNPNAKLPKLKKPNQEMKPGSTFPDSAQLTCPTHAGGNSIHIFVFVSSVLLRLSLATTSRDYSIRATRLGFPVVCLCRASGHNKNGAHYRGCKPLGYPFTTTFSGPLPPPIQEPTSPEITSPHIKEDITDPPIVPTVLNLGNGPRLVAYSLGTPDLKQVMAVALGLARDGAILCLQLQFSQAEYYRLIVALQFPQHLLSAAGFAEHLLSSFVQPVLAHHQMVLGLHIQEILSLQAAVT
ncbi:hypothetical protein DSO57_1013088 [Entomophthora muscae]|uniref:Uncharacterized protein n=1 Tax=Entomophthora muscae TaxID=34485 RepID=A0ACC2SJ91_9FUNG|nr:hypothetical protein DSO57_1013088 [Entomophthora muscae]